jgi:hypothetical protein
LDEPAYPPGLPEIERGRWKNFHSKLKATYLQYWQAQSLDTIRTPPAQDMFRFSWPHWDSDDPHHLKGTARQRKNSQYIALITARPADLTYLTVWGYSFMLATQWHVERGGLSMHSAAVARGDDGFLFLGPSAKGKSTVARMSASVGLSALGDDLNFIIKDAGKGYRLAATASPMLSPVGYSLLKPILRGVFALVQDERDYLMPMPPVQTARLLFDGFNQQTPYVRRIPDTLVVQAFHTACNIARRIPAYELHFRKSPDFWNVIHERFPD